MLFLESASKTTLGLKNLRWRTLLNKAFNYLKNNIYLSVDPGPLSE
jgi:hypothetical protein